MKEVPSYGKILTFGSRFTETALVGPVVIQEKVDGSLFAFGINEDGQLVFRSKGQVLHPEAPDKMFRLAVEYIFSIEERVRVYPRDTYFYCEYLQKPKHNTLKYDHTPTHNIVLFDVVSRGKAMTTREYLEETALGFGVDAIPELYRGEATLDIIKGLLETPSYLGEEIVEGVVIKNYAQTILVNGSLMPLFTKYVREAFKERHAVDWKVRSPKAGLGTYVSTFKSDARWQKAVQYLRDTDQLTVSPKDIGALIKRVQEDITTEEQENIKEELYRFFMPDILRTSTQGLPEWYKEQLAQRLTEQ